MTLSVTDILQIVGESYRSIQLKVLAFRNGNKLQNVMTMLRFSIDAPITGVKKKEPHSGIMIQVVVDSSTNPHLRGSGTYVDLLAFSAHKQNVVLRQRRVRVQTQSRG